MVKRESSYPEATLDYVQKLGLGKDEWQKILDAMGRVPNELESSLMSVLWSERVSGKSSISLLKTIDFAELGGDEIPGTDLARVDIDEANSLVATTSHSGNRVELNPYSAAQHCASQALASLLAIGASPLAVTSFFGVADPCATDSKLLLSELLAGLSHYLNIAGLPAAGEKLSIDGYFDGRELLNCSAFGLLKRSCLKRCSTSNFSPKLGDMLLYVGSDTRREAMPEFITSDPDYKPTFSPFSTINPLSSARFIGAFEELWNSEIPLICSPMGSGGIAASLAKLCGKLKKPLLLDLGRIPSRPKELNSQELLFSETDSRFFMVAKRENHIAISSVFEKYGLRSVVAGEVVDDTGLQIYAEQALVVDIPYSLCSLGFSERSYEVVKFPPMLKRAGAGKSRKKALLKKSSLDGEWAAFKRVTGTLAKQSSFSSSNLEDTWLDLLANANLCSRAAFCDNFDPRSENHMGNCDAESASAELSLGTLGLEENSSLITCTDCNPLYASTDPYLGLIHCAAHAMGHLAAMGAKPNGLSCCLNYGNPNEYRDICTLAESLRALGDLSRMWKIPFLSKSVRLREKRGITAAVPAPVLLLSALRPPRDFPPPKSSFTETGHTVILLGEATGEMSCSEYSRHRGDDPKKRQMAEIDFELIEKRFELIRELSGRGLISAARAVSYGGLALSLSAACLWGSSPTGISMDLKGSAPSEALLFEENPGRFLLGFPPSKEEEVKGLCEEYALPISGRGTVRGRGIELSGEVDLSIPLKTIYKIWVKEMQQLI